jgi:serine/threonine protein kinase
MNDKKDDSTISFASNATEAAPSETTPLTTVALTQDSLSPESSGASRFFDNRFKIEKELGRGGIGITYLATDLEKGEQVAIKSLLERLNTKDTAWVERHFRDEVAALSRIKHSGVVKFVASGLTPDGKPYIAMEYVEGVDLRSLIEPEKGADDFERIANLMQQLGDAISAAHDAGVYHRDLKPENVLITKPTANRAEEVKVIDFGIATVKNSVDEKTRATVLAGSVRYMAPEQLYGKPSATTDIYAMGVLAYEMITGRAPFNPDLKHPLAAMQQLLQMQKNGVRVKPQDLRPSLPDEAQAVILKALSFTPTDRYQRADEFGKALAEALTTHDEDKLTTQYIDKGTQVMTDPAVAPLSKPEQQTKVDGGRKTNVGRVAMEMDKTPTLVEEKASEIESKPETPQPPNTRIIKIAAVVITIVFLAVFSLLMFRDRNKNEVPPIQPPAKTYSLNYWTEAQKYKGNQRDGEPIRLLGSEAYFGKGDGLRFFVSSSDDGYLYLLYEDISKKPSTFAFLFPSPSINNASSQIKSGADLATSESLFDDKTGTEKVWIIWSAKAIPELEQAVTKSVNKEQQGEIKDAAQIAFIRNFLEQNASAKTEVSLDEVKRQWRVTGKNDTIVRLLSLQHR